MAKVGQSERLTQNKVIKLFQNRLGYEYLGNWHYRNNSNIEEEYLVSFLQKEGYDNVLINKAVFEIKKLSGVQTDELYDNNKNVYEMLRYGVTVRAEIGEAKETVKLVDWENLENNHFELNPINVLKFL